MKRSELLNKKINGIRIGDVIEKDTIWGGYDLNNSIRIPTNKSLLQKIAIKVFSKPETFDMNDWHNKNGMTVEKPREILSCGTTHCIAGYAEILHPLGMELHKLFGDGHTSEIGNILLGHEAASLFTSDDDQAKTFLKKYLPKGFMAKLHKKNKAKTKIK